MGCTACKGARIARAQSCGRSFVEETNKQPQLVRAASVRSAGSQQRTTSPARLGRSEQTACSGLSTAASPTDKDFKSKLDCQKTVVTAPCKPISSGAPIQGKPASARGSRSGASGTVTSTTILTSLAPEVTARTTSVSQNVQQNGQPKDLSACRLKTSNIQDTYDISARHVLGTGISGAVRVAQHKLTGRQYAIKTLSLDGVGAKKAAMLHNEVSIYLKLDHPNIAKLIEVYESEKSIHLVMELCTGGELYDRLAAKKKYSEKDAAWVTRQMLSAINYCHKHRICHRDLKLENWVYADKTVDAPLKLIDFGFSRIFNPGVPMTAMHGTVYYVSPEVMDGCYQEKCDIWSIGVIVYMLLSGSPPFNGAYDHEILVKIKRGTFFFAGPRWQGISDQAKDFISHLLCKDPDQRPSADDALKHPWLQRDGAKDSDIDLAVVLSMRDFALGNVLRRAAMAVVALTMTSREVMELERAFNALDKNNSGTIQLQDLVTVLVDKLNIDDEEARRIFERIDQTGTREVCYSEFIASTLQAKIVKQPSLIKEAFDRFDMDKKGAITLQNLRSVLGDTYCGSNVEDIMLLCDTDRDGVISFNEFTKALTSDEAALSGPTIAGGPMDGATGSIDQTPTAVPAVDISFGVARSSMSEEGSFQRHLPCESAFSALQSMRKATCMSADADF